MMKRIWLGVIVAATVPLTVGDAYAQAWHVIKADQVVVTQDKKVVTYRVITQSKSEFQVDISDLNLLIQDMLRASRRIGPRDIVVKYEALETQPNGDLWLTLLSRQRIAIRPTDLDAKTRVESAANGELLSARRAPSATMPSNDIDVSAKCAAEWPGDFAMREYCERRQREAQAKLNGRSMTSPNERIIRQKCGAEWPADYAMQDYCEVRQLEALRKIGGGY